MRGQPDVVCVGETMVLLVPDPPRTPDLAATFRREIGGAESNVAIHLARLGRRTRWHSILGDDAFGGFVRARIADEGVDCGTVRHQPKGRTGLYVKELGADGTTVAYYRVGSAATSLGAHDLDEVLAGRPRVVHTTGITAVLSDSCASLVEALLAEPPSGVLRSFDINYRPGLHGDRSAQRLRELAQRSDIVFCGLDEAQALWGAESPADVRDLLKGPDTVVVKQGPDGATAYRDGQSWHSPAPRVDVVEPVGAGDAFAAGVLDGILDSADMPDCLERGAALAGAALRVDGDLPPHDAGVYARFAGGRDHVDADVAKGHERADVRSR
ncbi:MAG TPA: sugar kinase [Blastococcus sp.]|nr:sugar kinase [Blastococcus sp.]